MIDPIVWQGLMVVFVFVVIFLMIPFGSGCKHKWKIIDSTLKKYTPFLSASDYTSKVYVQQCTHCGKIKQVEIK